MGATSLRRAVVRIPPELLGDLATIAERLFTETGLDYSGAAIVRGLLVIGLAALDGREHLAPAFIGARIKRGRKRSAPDAALDLGDADSGEGAQR